MRALVLAALVACKSNPSNVVATLDEAIATVDRMPGASESWRPARRGDTFVIGSAVRTGAASRAKLILGKTGKLDVQADSIVYFRRTPGRERDDIKVETGAVEIEAGDEAVGLGDAVLEEHGKARVTTTADGTTIVVTLGKVVLEDNVIAAGQTVTLSKAGAITPKPVDKPVTTVATTDLVVTITGKSARAGNEDLAPGEHHIAAGTALTTPVGSSATITHGGESATTEGPSELRVGDGALVGITTGAIAMRDAVATIPGGKVTTHGAATASVEPNGDAQVTSQDGDTSIETATGTTTLAPGESVTVTAKGAIERLPPPPKTTIVTIDPSESPTIHDPGAPTPIRVAMQCSGVVEVAKDRSFKHVVARSSGNVLVGAGTFALRVKCANGKTVTGSLKVVKDSGRTPLPKAAPSTRVDLDGREYTILYQNLLPKITLTWRNAPHSIKYTFVVGDKRFSSMTPFVTIPSGELHEGTYKMWGEIDGTRQSEPGKIVLDFDNAAPSASIDGVESDGTTLHVRGTVIEGSTVSIGSAAGQGGATPVDLDRHRRFGVDVPGEVAAVKIANPKSGTSYYVVHK